MGMFFPNMLPGSSVPSLQETGLISSPGPPCLSLPQAWALLSCLLPQSFPKQIPIHLLLFPPQTLPAPMPGSHTRPCSRGGKLGGIPSTVNRHNLELGRNSQAVSMATRAAVLSQRL